VVTSTLLHPHGDLKGNEVLIDILDDNQRRLMRDLNDITPECLYWQVDEDANSIAVILWHMGRILDVFFHQLTLGLPAIQERWFKGGWASKTGYDPRGIGRDGWGSVNEYSREEVAVMPKFELGLLLEFIDDVYTTLRKFLKDSEMSELSEPAIGFNGKFTKYQVISMALMDNIRHVGEIRLIKSLWERT
jgi:hypothetical protein